MATPLPLLRKGVLQSQDDVYSYTERGLRQQGRSMVAGKGGSRQRVYHCLQKKKGCPVVVRWCKQSSGDWKLTGLIDKHENCGGATTTSTIRGTIRGTFDVIDQIVYTDDAISGPKLKKAVEAATGSKLSLRSIQRAKYNIGKLIEANEAALMSKLRPYLGALEKGSPGTVTDVETDEEGRMTSCFFMLGKSVHVASKTFLQAASLDAAFLNTEHKGQLLTLCTKDDDNKPLLIALAITHNEDEISYTYLLSNAMKSPLFASIFNSSAMTIFIDGHKGSPPALQKCLPKVQVRRCVHHYLKDAPAIGAQDLSNNVFTAARAPTSQQFAKALEPVLQRKPATHIYLMTTLPLAAWTHHASAQDTRVGDVVSSNNAESAINMIGAEARGKVPVKALEAIIDQTAAKCAKRAKTGAETGEAFTPHAMKSFDTERTHSQPLFVKEYGNHTFKVEDGGLRPGSNTVDLQFRSPEDGGHMMVCTCGFCRRHCIPCRHVLATAEHLNRMDIARELISSGYSVQKYRAAYDNPDFGIRPPSLETLEDDPTLLSPASVTHMAGHPKGKRARKRKTCNEDFDTSSKSKTPMSAGAGGGAAASAASAGAFLSEAALSETALSETILSETALSETALPETALSKTALSETALSETALSKTALSQPTLSQPTLSQPTLSQPQPQPQA